MIWKLFCTDRCSACDRMKRNLHEVGIEPEVINMSKNGSHYNAMKYSFIRGAPTLVIVNEKEEVLDSYYGAIPIPDLMKIKKKHEPSIQPGQ